jgi:LmbE family N-acetylglucosaminyl deacetylase
MLRIFILHIKMKRSNTLQSSGTILIIAPHPDDEVLACSGLIQRMISENKNVHIAILSGGERTHSVCCGEKETIKNRHILTLQALGIIKFPLENLHNFSFPDGEISDTCLIEKEKLYNLLSTLQPDTVFIPHPFDRLDDHINAGNLIKSYYTKDDHISIYEYCVWFRYWFHHYEKIEWEKSYILKMTSEEQMLKSKAIDAYLEPIAPCGKPWSGKLPNILITASKWKKELFFKIK